MRRTKFSKLRIGLFVVLLGVVTLAATKAVAQTPAPAEGAAVREKMSFMGVVLGYDTKTRSYHFWTDPVYWVIFGLSITGLTLIIQGFIRARATVMFPESSTNHIREMIANRQFKELIEFTEGDPSFVSKALNPALKRAPSFAAMKEAMETAIGEETADQFRKIEYLNIIGNLGPLLGLLGTVVGMIIAFMEVFNAEGATDPSLLSGGIAKALAHTMLGLVLAVPCLAAFGVLRTLIDRLTVQGALISEELLLMVKPAEAKPAATAAIARPGAAPQPAGAPVPAVKKAPPGAPPVPNV